MRAKDLNNNQIEPGSLIAFTDMDGRSRSCEFDHTADMGYGMMVRSRNPERVYFVAYDAWIEVE